MKDRIRHLMETQHMSQQTFSDLIGVSPASLSSIFNGRTRPTLATVDAIRKKFPTLNLEWILYGHGPMFKDLLPADESSLNGQHEVLEEPLLNFDDSSAPLQGGSGVVSVHGVDGTPKKALNNDMKFINKPARKITEIRVFFDDLTYESFVPKK